MFGYNVVLEFSGNKFDLNDCSFSLSQQSDVNGKPQTDIVYGTFELEFPRMPSDEMLQWMMDPRKYTDATITLFDEDNATLMKLSLKKAACVMLRINYEYHGGSYCSTCLSLTAKSFTVGEVTLENDWKNIK